MTRIAILIAASLIISAAQAKEPYEGTWDESLVQCLDPESMSRTILGAKELTGYEEHCKFVRATKSRSTLNIAMNCDYADEPWKEIMALEVLGMNSLKITRNRNTTMMLRCPALPKEAQVEKLIDLWHNVNATCRGTTGVRAEAACDEREKIGGVLDTHNWCYGKENQIGAAMVWHECTSSSVRPSASQ
jgi:hypothetical protein